MALHFPLAVEEKQAGAAQGGKRMTVRIKCCMPCKPPERYPGCHDHCKKFKEEKAQNEKDMAAYKKKQAIQDGITSQKCRGVTRANRRKGRK